MNYTGTLAKMRNTHIDPVAYELPLGETSVVMNELLGKTISIVFSGTINCVECGRKTKKSFNQGYCFPCFRSLAACDRCIMSPELCHFDQGTCREPDWALDHCMQPHIVYLANSSGVKVGITRGTQVPTRWIDQGAIQALPIYRVQSRRTAGLVEVHLKQFMTDRTDWRKMLKNDVVALDLAHWWSELKSEYPDLQADILSKGEGQEIEPLTDNEALSFNYPVLEYPEKVKTYNLDKQAEVTGKLAGIKGQYLILDTGVLNIRKFGGYEVELSVL